MRIWVNNRNGATVLHMRGLFLLGGEMIGGRGVCLCGSGISIRIVAVILNAVKNLIETVV